MFVSPRQDGVVDDIVVALLADADAVEERGQRFMHRRKRWQPSAKGNRSEGGSELLYESPR